MPRSEVTKRQQEQTRAEIARLASRCAGRVAAFVMNEPYEKGGVPEMNGAHIAAAKLLIDKVLPSLSSVDMDVTSEPVLDEAQAQAKLAAWLIRNPRLVEHLKAKGVTVDSTASTPELETGPSQTTHN